MWYLLIIQIQRTAQVLHAPFIKIIVERSFTSKSVLVYTASSMPTSKSLCDNSSIVLKGGDRPLKREETILDV